MTYADSNSYPATSGGKVAIDKLDVESAGAGRRAAQVGGLAVHANVGHPDRVRRLDSRRARDHGEDGGQSRISDAIMESRTSIAMGETIAAPLQKSAVFPPMVISMISVGEQTGGLDEMLSKNADSHDEEVDADVSNLLSLMEPVMIEPSRWPCTLYSIDANRRSSAYFP